jgi:TRAP-type C4-dicarboxylate transport system substrate-binding protein
MDVEGKKDGLEEAEGEVGIPPMEASSLGTSKECKRKLREGEREGGRKGACRQHG